MFVSGNCGSNNTPFPLPPCYQVDYTEQIRVTVYISDNITLFSTGKWTIVCHCRVNVLCCSWKERTQLYRLDLDMNTCSCVNY